MRERNDICYPEYKNLARLPVNSSLDTINCKANYVLIYTNDKVKHNVKKQEM